MISTVTTTTVTTITSIALVASFVLLSAVILLALLIHKELLEVSGDEGKKTRSRVLNIALIPMALVFAFIVIVTVGQAIE